MVLSCWGLHLEAANEKPLRGQRLWRAGTALELALSNSPLPVSICHARAAGFAVRQASPSGPVLRWLSLVDIGVAQNHFPVVRASSHRPDARARAVAAFLSTTGQASFSTRPSAHERRIGATVLAAYEALPPAYILLVDADRPKFTCTLPARRRSRPARRPRASQTDRLRARGAFRRCRHVRPGSAPPERISFRSCA